MTNEKTTRRLFARTCLECGETFQTPKATTTFCPGSQDCKNAFNNRRLKRGAQLYDLWMTMRYARGFAKGKAIFTLMTALSRKFRTEDMAERNGRPSWDVKAYQRFALAYDTGPTTGIDVTSAAS